MADLLQNNSDDDDDFEFVDIEKVKQEVKNKSDDESTFVEIENNSEAVKQELLMKYRIKQEVSEDEFKNADAFMESNETEATDFMTKPAKEKKFFPEDEYLSCDQCSLTTPYISNLAKHKKMVHDKVRFPCEICNRDFADIKSHNDVVHAKVKKFMCDMCDYSCVREFRLNAHKYHQHIKQQVWRNCPICFVNCADLEGHIQRIHEKPVPDDPFPCKECDFIARTRNTLKNHIRTVHKKVMINCSFCQKSINKWTASVHMRKHLDNKFQCKPCDKTYREKRDLAKHILYAHKNFRHKCQFCEKEVPNILQHVKFMHKDVADQAKIDMQEENEIFKDIKRNLGVNLVYNAEF